MSHGEKLYLAHTSTTNYIQISSFDGRSWKNSTQLINLGYTYLPLSLASYNDQLFMAYVTRKNLWYYDYEHSFVSSSKDGEKWETPHQPDQVVDARIKQSVILKVSKGKSSNKLLMRYVGKGDKKFSLPCIEDSNK